MQLDTKDKKMNRAKFSCSLARWTLPLLILAPMTISAQTASTERNKQILKIKADLPAGTLSLPQTLRRLHEQSKINIVVSGTPLLPDALIKETHTVEEALETLAEAFDYHWTMNKRGIVLLTKAFRKNGDYPQLDEKWIRHFAKENVTILEAASQGAAFWREEVVTLAKMLQPEQWLVLQSGQSLDSSTFTGAQLQQIQRAGLANRLFDEKQAFQQLSNFLSQIDKAKVQLASIKVDDLPEDGLPYELRLYDANSQVSPIYELVALGNSSPKANNPDLFPTSRRLTDADYFEETRGREHLAGVSGRWSKSINLLKTDITFKELLSLLATPEELDYSAEIFLLNRQYSMYCQGVTKRALTDALAEIEDWHWNESKPGKVIFQPRALKDANDILAIPRRLQAALPRDLRDYLGARRPSLTAQVMVSTLVSDPQMRRMQWFERRKRSLGYSDLKTLMLHLASSKSKEEIISVIKLKVEDRQLLVNTLLGQAMSYGKYSLYGGDFPPYILAPHKAHLELQKDQLRIMVTQITNGSIASIGFGASVAKVMPAQTSNPPDADQPAK